MDTIGIMGLIYCETSMTGKLYSYNIRASGSASRAVQEALLLCHSSKVETMGP